MTKIITDLKIYPSITTSRSKPDANHLCEMPGLSPPCSQPLEFVSFLTVGAPEIAKQPNKQKSIVNTLYANNEKEANVPSGWALPCIGTDFTEAQPGFLYLHCPAHSENLRLGTNLFLQTNCTQSQLIGGARSQLCFPLGNCCRNSITKSNDHFR